MSVALESVYMSDMSSDVDHTGKGVTCLDGQQDRDFVERAQTGDVEAFEELVRRYRNDVFALACHFVRNRDDAWDISQEVFIKTHRSLRRFRGDASFKTWLMRITANQCKDFLKRRRLKTVALEQDGAFQQPASRAPGPGSAAEAREIGDAIEKTLESIPFKHRTAFVLRELEGLSYEEMAQVMGCSLGTVMSRLHHARRKLRKGLSRMGHSRSVDHA